jgi:hypothetical protein
MDDLHGLVASFVLSGHHQPAVGQVSDQGPMARRQL